MYPISLLEPTCSLIFNANDTSACLVASLFDDRQADANDKHTHTHSQTERRRGKEKACTSAIEKLTKQSSSYSQRGRASRERKRKWPSHRRKSRGCIFFNLSDQSHLPKGNKSAHLFLLVPHAGHITWAHCTCRCNLCKHSSPSPSELLFNFALIIDHSQWERRIFCTFSGWSSGLWCRSHTSHASQSENERPRRRRRRSERNTHRHRGRGVYRRSLMFYSSHRCSYEVQWIRQMRQQGRRIDRPRFFLTCTGASGATARPLITKVASFQVTMTHTHLYNIHAVYALPRIFLVSVFLSFFLLRAEITSWWPTAFTRHQSTSSVMSVKAFSFLASGLHTHVCCSFTQCLIKIMTRVIFSCIIRVVLFFFFLLISSVCVYFFYQFPVVCGQCRQNFRVLE